MKPLVIYHANCADGFGAAFAAWLKLGDEAEYVAMKYGEVESIEDWLAKSKPIYGGREVYILDFSFPKEVMDQLFSYAKRIVWLDHHKTAFEMWCATERNYFRDNPADDDGHPSFDITLDNSRSGALIAWEYFHPDTEVPMLIRHIDDYDRWQFKIEGTKAFNKALWSYAPWSFEQWRNMLSRGSWVDEMVREGEAILRAHEQNVQSVVKAAAMACSVVPAIIDSADSYKAPWVWWKDPVLGDTCGANGLAANCPPHLSSDVGHELANQSGTFGLCWSFSNDGKVKCSLRSNGDYDVSAIAKAFGGGGHRNAAGFETDINTLMGWLK